LFQIALYEPEIAPNTGNIIRLCANTGIKLHLIEPLGFQLDDKRLRRAGLDYHEFASMQLWPSLAELERNVAFDRILAVSTKGTCRYDQAHYGPGDLLLFGPETRGLPATLLNALPPEQVVYIPMRPDSRSLNLSNAVAVMAYTAWSQQGFPGAAV